MILRNTKRIHCLVGLLAALSIASYSSTHSAWAAEESIDSRMAAGEAQLREQKEQNRQILMLLQSMTGQKPGPPSTIPTPGESANSGAEAGMNKAKTASAIDPSQLAPGWLVEVYAVEKGHVFSGELPKAELGGFAANKSGYNLSEYAQFINMRVANKGIMWRGEAFLEIKEAGSHLFIFDVAHATWGAIFVEGVEVASAIGVETALGSMEFKPGMYKIEIRLGGSCDRNGVSLGYLGNSNFAIKFKRPSDDMPVPISDVLFMKKSGK